MDRLRKYEPDKIALLAFFAVGLLIAFVMTATRYTGPARAGTELVQRIKEKRFLDLVEDEQSRSFFTITSESGHIIGFAMSVHDDTNSFSEYSVSMASLVYMPALSGYEQITLFQCDESFDRFDWKTEMVGSRTRFGMHITAGRDGTVIVGNSANNTQQQFKLQTPTVPSYLLDVLIMEMLKSTHGSIIVDIVEWDGTMTSAAVRKVRRTIGQGGQRLTMTAIEVDLLDDRGYSQMFFFDDQGRISRIRIKQDRVYIFDRAGPEEIEKLFPDRVSRFSEESEI